MGRKVQTSSEMRSSWSGFRLAEARLLVNHDEEVLESEPGLFDKLLTWHGETVTRFRMYFSGNSAVIAHFEGVMCAIRDPNRRRFEAISIAVAHFAAFYEKERAQADGHPAQEGLLAKWESSFAH